MGDDDTNALAVTTLGSSHPTRSVLFAVGRGGDPRRHLPLLETLAERGCRVVAPHFDMLASPVPTEEELNARIARLGQALCAHVPKDLPLIGLGHSIGSAMLLALTGAVGETMAGGRFASPAVCSFKRLALLAPATAFFRRPGALDAVHVGIRVWAGGQDAITPPDHAALLQTALEGRCAVTVRIAEDAGHFTYMNEPPPGMVEPHPDRNAFLAALTREVAEYVEGRV